MGFEGEGEEEVEGIYEAMRLLGGSEVALNPTERRKRTVVRATKGRKAVEQDSYEKETVERISDAAFICNLLDDGQSEKYWEQW